MTKKQNGITPKGGQELGWIVMGDKEKKIKCPDCGSKEYEYVLSFGSGWHDDGYGGYYENNFKLYQCKKCKRVWGFSE